MPVAVAHLASKLAGLKSLSSRACDTQGVSGDFEQESTCLERPGSGSGNIRVNNNHSNHDIDADDNRRVGVDAE